MRRIWQNTQWFWGVSLVLMALLFLWAPNAPINVDEFLHGKQAKMVVDWFLSFGVDDSCLQNRPDNLRYYGQSVDNFAAAITAIFHVENVYLVRHYLGALMGWLLLLVTGLLTRSLTKNQWYGIVAMLALFISPRPFGQVFGNLKDIPFALGYVWATWGTIRFIKEMPLPSLKKTFFLAGAIAFSISVRIGGVLSFFILGFFVLLWIAVNYRRFVLTQMLLNSWQHYGFIGIVFICVGYFGGLLFWPFGLQNPILNPISALSLMSHYAISIRQIFEGEFYWSTHLPWYYAFKWLFISIPEFVWLAIITFVGFLIHNGISKKTKVHWELGILIFSALFPLIYVVIIGSNLYSGWRQLYFIYPLFVVLGVLGVKNLMDHFENLKVKISIAAIFVLLMILPVKHIVNTFPNHYVYFNAIANRNNECWSNYEYDYYFHGMKQASNWLFENTNVPDGSVIASNLDLTPYFPKEKNLTFKYIHFYEYHAEKWDYAILSNNYVHPFQLKNNKWLPSGRIKTMYHKGNPIAVILKWDNEEALVGQLAFDKGLYYKSAKHFNIACEKDKNNMHLKSLLALSYLNEGRLEEAKTVIQEGLDFNPYNEPLHYLGAKVSFAEENYHLALRQTQELLNLNSKYKSAYPLLVSIYERLGDKNKAKKIKQQIK